MSQQKFAEMHRNKHKLDKMNFRINRNALGVQTIAENATKLGKYKTIDEQYREEISLLTQKPK